MQVVAERVKRMAEIRVIRSSTVQAANLKADGDGDGDASAHPTLTELSPLDLSPLLRGPIQKGLLFRIPTTADKSSIIASLKQSLSSTLHFFPPLAGRFTVVQHSDNSSSFFLDCNNSGALFVHAVATDTTVADILEPIYVPHIVHSFFPLNGLKNHEGTTNPLLGVQVTELSDGIFLGCTMNHSIVDGVSFWHFLNSWSEISRSGFSNQISKPPLLQRWFPPEITRPIRIPFTPTTTKPGKQNLDLGDQRVFHFPKEKIAEIKENAKREANTDTISSLQALLSHIWRAVIRNQKVDDPEKEMSCILGIGTRGRMRPPLADNYFGNAVQLAGRVTMKAGEVVGEGGLGKAAWHLKKMVSSNTEEKLRGRVDSFLKEPRLETLSEVVDGALMISSSPRFDVYGNDFGWGKPVGVRSGVGNKRFGKVTLFQGEEEGSVDIEACLSLPLLEGMGNDSEFMAFVAH